jgi:hypothetical protein
MTVTYPLPGLVNPDGRVHLPDQPRWPWWGGPTGPIIRRVLSGGAAASGASGVTTLQATPTGQQADDWMLAFVAAVGGVTTISTPSPGWSEVIPQLTQGSTITGSLWKKKAGTSEAGPYQWDVTASLRMGIIIVAYSGADPNDVIDVGQTSIEGTSAQQLDHNSLVPSAPRCWHLLCTASNSAAPDDNLVTLSPPDPYGEQAETASTHASNANVHMDVADRELPDAGVTGVRTVAITGGVNRQLVGIEAILRVPTSMPYPYYQISQYAGFY